MDTIPIIRFIIDALILFVLLVLLAVLKYAINPFYSGFYCDDFSVNLPFKPSTVSNKLLIIVSLALPLCFILLTEIARTVYMKNKGSYLSLHNRYKVQLIGGRIVQLPEQTGNIIVNYSTYLFGLLCTLNLTLIGKQTIGRVRPNFLDVCKPSVRVYELLCTKNQNYLIPLEHFQCANKNLEDINESRKSFPSGHSSTSFFVAIFLILYVHKRWHKRNLGLLPQLVQFILFALAFFTALSRVVDNKHHPSDVLAGSTLGCLIATFTYFYLNLFYKRYNYKNKYDTNSGHIIVRSNETVRLVDLEAQSSNMTLLSAGGQKNCPKAV